MPVRALGPTRSDSLHGPCPFSPLTFRISTWCNFVATFGVFCFPAFSLLQPNQHHRLSCYLWPRLLATSFLSWPRPGKSSLASWNPCSFFFFFFFFKPPSSISWSVHHLPSPSSPSCIIWVHSHCITVTPGISDQTLPQHPGASVHVLVWRPQEGRPLALESERPQFKSQPCHLLAM